MVAITLVGGYGAAALNLAARRQREKDSERAATKRGFDRGVRGHAASGRRAARVGPTLFDGVGPGSRRHCRLRCGWCCRASRAVAKAARSRGRRRRSRALDLAA